MGSIPTIKQTYSQADKPLGHKANLGLIVLQTDETFEHDLRRTLPLEGYAAYVNRIAVAPTISVETVKAMQSRISQSAPLLPQDLSYEAGLLLYLGNGGDRP